jgi:hypothetical protein
MNVLLSQNPPFLWKGLGSLLPHPFERCMGNDEGSIPTTPNALGVMYINGGFRIEDLKTILIMGLQELSISENGTLAVGAPERVTQILSGSVVLLLYACK